MQHFLCGVYRDVENSDILHRIHVEWASACVVHTMRTAEA